MTRKWLNALLLAAAAASAGAQDYPTKAITITVPNPPGGMNQIHAQPLSAVIERLTKHPAPVVNRPGAPRRWERPTWPTSPTATTSW